METAWIALIATIFGGGGLKIIEHFLGRHNTADVTAASMREELRKDGQSLKVETHNLREEIRAVERELDQWKEKYFTLVEEYMEAKLQLQTYGKHSKKEVE